MRTYTKESPHGSTPGSLWKCSPRVRAALGGPSGSPRHDGSSWMDPRGPVLPRNPGPASERRRQCWLCRLHGAVGNLELSLHPESLASPGRSLGSGSESSVNSQVTSPGVVARWTRHRANTAAVQSVEGCVGSAQDSTGCPPGTGLLVAVAMSPSLVQHESNGGEQHLGPSSWDRRGCPSLGGSWVWYVCRLRGTWGWERGAALPQGHCRCRVRIRGWDLAAVEPGPRLWDVIPGRRT